MKISGRIRILPCAQTSSPSRGVDGWK